MSPPVVVVGAGASALHFAASALDRGCRILLLDVGHEGPEPALPEADFEGLKDGLPDPISYFLGEDLRGVVDPDFGAEYYGLPPGKDHVFRGVPGFRMVREGFEPLVSFARGGLAEAWTGGSYPYTRSEASEFPVPYDELFPWYAEVSRRIGVAGVVDDLEEFMPGHPELQEPLRLDDHSAALLERYRARRDRLRRRHRFHLGRSRIAVLSRDLRTRKACDHLGRCLLGCPRGSLYTPASTLEELRGRAGFEYRPGVFVSHLVAGPDRRVRGVALRPAAGGEESVVPATRLVLGAGALGTGRILLESLRRVTGEDARLPGLMDNRQVLIPFLNLLRLGRRPDFRSYQYHQVAVGLETSDAGGAVHGQITTLKTALVHPIVSGLPVDLRTGLRILRRTHAALGLLNANFPDRRRAGCWLGLDPSAVLDRGGAALRIRYEPPPGEAAEIRDAVRRIARALRILGCVVPPGMVHVRPMGASVHYAGTLPMTREPSRFTTDPSGRSRDFENLWIVDGSVFPALPAKQLTFTMMANAARIGAAFEPV